MSRIERYKKEISKLDENLVKEEKKLEGLSDQFHSKQISSDNFVKKKEKITGKIKTMQSRMHLLKGLIVKEHRKQKEDN